MRGRWLDLQRYAVWGLGRSGIAAANLLAARGKQVLATDPGKKERPGELDPRAMFAAGPNTVGEAEVVIASPGLAPSSAVFRGLKVPVVSEIELAWSACATPVLGITGTDGKTTTTELTAHILAHNGRKVVAAGNIGVPLTAVIDGDLDVIVAEVSAFQLWSTHDFRVDAAAITNIAADHLDYFDSWDEYVAAKRILLANCGSDDWGVFNWDDPTVREWGREFGGCRALVSTAGRPQGEADLRLWLEPENGILWADRGSDSQLRFLSVPALEASGLRGLHNVANVLMAAALVATRGVGLDTIGPALADFEVSPHRVQLVRTFDDVRYYDDSKATNANAALAGIRSLKGRLVVIAGGVDKQIALDELAAVLETRARTIVLIGEVRERFREALLEAGCGAEQVIFADTMAEAVALTRSAARPGDSVLLSPACSSFDMFESYADRGDQFQNAVRALL